MGIGVIVINGVIRDRCEPWMFQVPAYATNSGCPGSRAIEQVRCCCKFDVIKSVGCLMWQPQTSSTTLPTVHIKWMMPSTARCLCGAVILRRLKSMPSWTLPIRHCLVVVEVRRMWIRHWNVLRFLPHESKKQDTLLLPIWLCQMLTDFQNSFTIGLNSKHVMK